MAELKENHIEWYSGADTMTLSLTQAKYINRVRRMLEKHPSMGAILAENQDGSILAHISLRALHLTVFTRKNVGSKAIDEEDEE